MTEVWFYVTEDASAGARAVLLRKLIERALRSPRRLYILASDAQAAERLDQWLWEPATSFLPHGLAGTGHAGRQAVVIGHGDAPAPHQDILVNLAEGLPPVCEGFQRVVELVGGSNNDRTQSRERWKAYRDKGFIVTKHELGA